MKTLSIFAAIVVLCVFTSTTYGQTITTFDVPNSTFTYATGITSSGVVTGYYADSSGTYYGFLRRGDGTVVTFDPPNSTECDETGRCMEWYAWSTEPRAINPAGTITGTVRQRCRVPNGGCLGMRRCGFVRDVHGTISTFCVEQYAGGEAINPRGQVIGSSSNEVGTYEPGFLRQPDGTIDIIDVPGSPHYVYPTGINAAGQITGNAQPGIAQPGAFLRQPDGSVVRFDVAGQSAWPAGISSASEVMGYYVDTVFNYHGFVRDRKGAIITFGVPNATQIFPRAVNAAGHITGFYTDASYRYHGFLRLPHGIITTFDVPNATYTYPTAISTSGDVAGWYVDASNTVHAFVRSR